MKELEDIKLDMNNSFSAYYDRNRLCLDDYELSDENVDLGKDDEDKDDYDEHDEADVADWEGMEKRIKNLEDAVADLKRDKVGGDDEVEEMSEETPEPSTNPKTIKLGS